jgi:hypothetical protein
VLLSYGYGHFADEVSFYADGATKGVAIADFDRSGLLDVATTHTDGAVRVMFGIPVKDADADNLTDLVESMYGTDPGNPDTDGDGLPDGFEMAQYCLVPLIDQRDLDHNLDGTSDLDEYMQGDEPCGTDSDDDGMSDPWENHFICMQPGGEDDDEDYDFDEVTNVTEFITGTSPCNPDTDGDGINDYDELHRAGITYIIKKKKEVSGWGCAVSSASHPARTTAALLLPIALAAALRLVFLFRLRWSPRNGGRSLLRNTYEAAGRAEQNHYGEHGSSHPAEEGGEGEPGSAG